MEPNTKEDREMKEQERTLEQDELNSLRSLDLDGLRVVHSLLTLEEMKGKDITGIREMVWKVFNEKLKEGGD